MKKERKVEIIISAEKMDERSINRIVTLIKQIMIQLNEESDKRWYINIGTNISIIQE